jgi:fructan beta-fructosidase
VVVFDGGFETGASAPSSTTVGRVPAADDERRPLLHFTPERGWLNDPNGLVWHEGRWHLFFQHNPHGTDWGHMSWGHAVSTDLLTWDERPVAIAEGLGQDGVGIEAIFSGSGVVHDDTMVAVYTSSHTPAHPQLPGIQAQSLAVSRDGGETWEKHATNPVLDRSSGEFRDPKVFRQNGRWLMVAVEAVQHLAVLYASDDLTRWTLLSEFADPALTAGPWECPDLFPLPLDGDPNQVRWVLLLSVASGAPGGGSGTCYYVGDFDGVDFTAEETGWVDHGRDYYAAATWNDAPDDRRVSVAWMSNWAYAATTPAGAWRGAMTLPRDLTLVSTPAGARLRQQVVAEVAAYLDRDAARQLEEVALDPGETSLALEADVALVEVLLRPGAAGTAGISVFTGGGHALRIGYDAHSGELVVDRRSGEAGLGESFASVSRAPVPLVDGTVALEVWLDRTSVEVFAHDGQVVVTDLVFPPAGACGVDGWAEGGPARLDRLRVTPVHRPLAAAPD